MKTKHAMLQASVLCNDTAIVDGQTAGDPTETALADYYMTQFDDYDTVKKDLPRLSELPFDSDRKLMSTLHHIDGEYVMYTKGALDVILDRTEGLSEEEKEAVRKTNFEFSNQGLRVLGLCPQSYRQKKEP